ncbi:MAG: hypothetical protein LUC93_02285 [Planctomycetaceae bacterium]|nr:hypothetical protein [Planctomycetaceae bacterium]
MLRAPELAATPYDPSLEAVIKPTTLPEQGPAEGLDDEAELDMTLVKHAVTGLHQEEERQFRSYEEYDGPRIAEIVQDHALFLKNQRAICTQSLKTNRRKGMFDIMTGAYFSQSMNRARHLQRQKTRAFHVQTVEAQNEEFLNRALLPQNACDDQTQTAYRNMILLNLENLYADAPETERREALDKAAEVIYRKIIEKRLEIAPASVQPLLIAPAVRRVLGDAAVREYRKRAADIERDEKLRREATDLVDREVSPQEAKSWAKRRRPEDRAALLSYYETLRYNHHRKRCFTRILNIDAVWRELVANDCNPDSIPAWVKNTEPKMYSAVMDALAVREKNGGLPIEPNYQTLLEFTATYEPHTACEKLADEDALYSFIGKLGGPDAPAFQLCLRMLLGKGTDADKAWLRDIGLAEREYQNRIPEDDGTPEGLQAFLSRFDTARRIRLTRTGHEELDEVEVREIVAALDRGWVVEERLEKNN